MLQNVLKLSTRFGSLRQLYANQQLGRSNSIKFGHSFYRSLSTINEKKGQYITYEIKDNVAVVRFNDLSSKVNSLSEGLMKEAEAILAEVRGTQLESTVKAIVFISGKPDCFVAGADINMLERCKTASEAEMLSLKGHKFLNEIEESPIPVVAAIKGSCLGGGLELALASHYRIAVNDKSTVLAVPEVMLGLLPGGGGTQRLTKLVNVPDALQMMLTAKNIRPSKAKSMGLVDAVVQPLGPGVSSAEDRTLEYLEEVAVQTAKQLAEKKLKIDRKRPLQERLLREALKIKFVRDKVLDKARDEVNKFAKGNYPAPLKIIEVVETALSKSSEEGYAHEAKAFGQLTQTSESKALIGLFHGHTHCKKNHFGKPNKYETVAVLGAGLMGAGIAQVTVDRGINTILKDTAQKGLERGQKQIHDALDKKLAKKKLSILDHDRFLSNLLPTLNYDKFREVDVVIEAVFEDIKVKHKVLQEVESVTRDDCIFASNTSALPITEIAAASKRPDKVIGMHYFSPVDKMPLLEIVATDKTSQETISTAVDLGLKQKKVVIVVKDCPGFYTTRCLSPGMSEIILMLQEGLSPKELDSTSTKFGFPIGVTTLIDEVGIDVAAHVATYMRSIHPERFAGGNPQLLLDMVAAGNLGRKSGKGFYLYDKNEKSNKKGERQMNPSALEILKKHSVNPKLKHNPDDLQQRLASRFINEAILCLQEDILRNPLEGDIGAIFGLGFPPFLGGPFRFIDAIGAQQAVDVMYRFADIYGPQFIPCQLLLDHAKDPNKKFHVKN